MTSPLFKDLQIKHAKGHSRRLLKQTHPGGKNRTVIKNTQTDMADAQKPSKLMLLMHLVCENGKYRMSIFEQ
jgi:hypothetical protein